MNEFTVLKRSGYIFLIGCLILGIVSVIFHDISYIFGLVLGYIINVIVFLLIIKMSEGILKFSMSTAIIAIMFLVKLVLYALGFFIAVKTPWFHILGVFLGYMCTKITIYVEQWIHKGGEVDG